ncbi:hypothetical protein JCM15548_11922 [Geofilum rubicundum JCM 15548]|uniref:3-keto-alpha-glucoside-1,2-lyase/3-keto-2-hydroxy-glucal hydratase domain-containing protein n=2 Tax=Geofilum TaxID=1236988 RepID=A0A0E9LWL9_9BACT|nr:hypothetical protein JCM15548_11922 [Geofilum rubicundum JCM 15548]
MNAMKNLILAGILVLTVWGCNGPQSVNEDWQPLFNGENLEGWDIKFTHSPMGVNYKNTFRVEEGLLKVRYDEWDSLNNIFGHLMTKESYSHYKVRAEYRFVGEQVKGGADWAYRNNGIMIHSQSAESMRLDQDFPVSIEVQLLGGDGSGPVPT